MPHALEARDSTLRRIEQGEIDSIEIRSLAGRETDFA